MTVGHSLVSSILSYPIPCHALENLVYGLRRYCASMVDTDCNVLYCPSDVWMDTSPTPGASSRDENRDGDLPLLCNCSSR